MLRIYCKCNNVASAFIRGFRVEFMQSCLHSNRPISGIDDGSEKPKKESQRLTEFRKKLRETTDIDDLGDQPQMHPAQKNDALSPFPNNTNPTTGEVGGPRGPEPTRYGDWERKGRVSDF